MRSAIFVGLLLTIFVIGFIACNEDTPNNEPKLIFKFKFDSTQTRLDNTGNVSTMPTGHAGQHPDFKKISAHYIELAETGITALGSKGFLYKAEEVTTGGSNAIDFDKAIKVSEGETFFSIPLKDVKAGSYEHLMVSLAYQNYIVQYYIDTLTYGGIKYPIKQEFPSEIASFIGFNSYIKSYTLGDTTITVNANQAQGYWGARFKGTVLSTTFSNTLTGNAPAGATTVVNPFASFLQGLPPNSCLVVGKIKPGKLTITGQETKDIVVEVSLSTNKSFEWVEVGTPNGKWEPLKGEQVVDMGIRGMIPTIK